jgi:hypothetical protein
VPTRGPADAVNLSAAVSFPGRVLDLETGKPVPGAVITVERSLPVAAPTSRPAWAGTTAHKTDQEGRFALVFPAEQVAERRLAVRLRISHPGYIARKTNRAIALVELLVAKRSGEASLWDQLKLEKGVEFTGQVITPDERPAAGANYEFVRWGEWANQSPHLVDDSTGTTDLEGRFRTRFPRSQQLAIYVTPVEHAPFQHFWGPDQPEQRGENWIQPDLGRIVLSRGIRLSGRLVDLEGRPAAGEVVLAESIYSRFTRTTTTGVDGRFTFAPLRQGNYLVRGAGQKLNGGINTDEPPLAALGTVFRPTNVYLRDGIVPQPLVIRELPTVAVLARFVDSREKPHHGYSVGLWGELPMDKNPQQQQKQEAIFDGNGISATINGPEHENKVRQTGWAAQLVPDATGRVVFRAPKGLLNAMMQTFAPDETCAIRGRFGEGKPLQFWSGGRLDDLKADAEGITFVVYKSPTLFVTVKTEDGEAPYLQVGVNGSFSFEGGDFGTSFIEQPDHRYRSQYLMPNVEYELAAWSPGFVPNRVEHLKLREGSSAELTLVLRRQPRPPLAGNLAPPFFVRTNDGRAVSLDDLRGKFVLLHFWHPQWDNCVQELPGLKKLHDRFGKNERMTFLGFCLVKDPAEALKIIKGKEVTWPQVTLRDRWNDSIIVEYQAGQLPNAILIGPDGKLIARDLQGDKLDEAVKKAMGQK